MKSFKHVKYLTLFGFGTLLVSFLGISLFQNSGFNQASQGSNVLLNQSKLITKAVGKPDQSLGQIRHFQNNNFTGIPVKNSSIEGTLVLTGDASITRTDFFGNILWTFDPNVSGDIIAAKSDANGNLVSNGDGTPVLSGTNYTNSLQGKMVIEATQDQSNPNIFYLLLIPKDYQTQKTYADVNSDSKNQGTIVVISEDLNLTTQPYGIIGVQNIKPEDMVQNYPTSWRTSTATGPTFFTKTNHNSYFDSSDTNGTAISMPWNIYIANLGNIYANNGIVYIAGGNGTIFNNEDVLSIGMFRISFNFSSQQSTSIGWPYALLLKNLGIVLRDGTSSIINLPMGQDSNFQYVPRMAVAGLVSAQDRGETTTNKLSLLGTITLGTKTDQSTSTTALTSSDIGDNAVNINSVTAAKGNSYTVQTLFEAYLNLQSLNALSSFNATSSATFGQALYTPSSISVGVPYELYSNSQTNITNKIYIESYLYALTAVGSFSPRNVGNVVSFINDQDTNTRSYYFQLGGYLVKMYPPLFENITFTNSRLSMATQDFAKTSSYSANAKNKWTDFRGTFMIGGDNNPSATNVIIGSAWSTGVYYNKFRGTTATVQASNTQGRAYTNAKMSALTSIATNNYSSDATGVLGYLINSLRVATNEPAGATIDGVVSSTGTNQAYVSVTGTNDYWPVTYAINANALQFDAGAYTNISKTNLLGNGSFKTRNEIDQSFFTNSIDGANGILVNSNNIQILDPKYRSLIFAYNRPDGIGTDDWRIVALSSNINDNIVTFAAEVKNPLTGEYTPIPNAQSTLLNSATFTGFNALPAYVLPVAIAVPIVVVALILGLSLGIGIPMHKNKQALKQGFDISNKKVDTLTTAVGSVFKQIINRTQIGNIKKSPQMLKSTNAKKPVVKKPGATTPSTAEPKKPTAPTPAKPKPPVKAPGKDVK